MKRFFTLIFLSLISFYGTTQPIIKEIDIYNLNGDSINSILNKFLFCQEEVSSLNNGVIFFDYSRDTLLFQYDASLFNEKTEKLFRFFTGASQRYDYFLLTYKNKGYIVNMKNSLDSILKKVNSISTFTNDFLEFCSVEIKKIHYSNWENHYDIKPTYMDEDGNYWPIEYDPNKW